MKEVLSYLLALVLVFSITPSVFAEEPVGGTTIYVDAISGNDTQEGGGTTSDKAYKTVAAAVAAASSGDCRSVGKAGYTPVPTYARFLILSLLCALTRNLF